MSLTSSIGHRFALGSSVVKLFSPLLAALLVSYVSANTADAAPNGIYRGQAYGTFANAEAGSLSATLGRSAFQPCPCEGTDGELLTNRISNVVANNVFRAGETTSTGITRSNANTATIEFVSKVEGLNVFDGLISATAVTGVANTRVNANSITGDISDSRFVGLEIAGRKISSEVEPNTRIPLPGIGVIVLKRVNELGNGRDAGRIAVDMIVINVTERNTFDLAVGAQIIIGHAASGFERRNIDAVFDGAAWGATSNKTLSSRARNRIGRLAFITLPCVGTGEVRSNSGGEVVAEGILSIAEARSTAFGGRTKAGRTARTTARVNNVELLGGRIVAANITAVAKETLRRNGNRTRSTEGSHLTGLRVLGTQIPISVQPNTQLPIPGFGVLVINEQIIPADGAEGATTVNGLRLVITRANVLNLPIGSEIIVAHAHASAEEFVPASNNRMASR
jgi:hypothetical protein